MKDSIRILFVEDVQTDAEMIWTEISRNNIKFEKKLVDNKADYIDALTSFDPQMIISDYSLPQFDGLSALFIKNEKNLSIPFILVTGSINEEVAVDMMKAGVDDYVIKQNLSRLGPAILGTLKKQEILCEKEAAENALRESEERFRMLFDQAPISYQSLDFDGNIIEVNETWLGLLGYYREDVLGKWFGSFLAPDYVEIFRERFPLFKERGKIHSEFEMIKKDGSYIIAAFDGRIGHSSDGKFKQTHCVLEDVTDKRLTEQAFRLKVEELERFNELSVDRELSMIELKKEVNSLLIRVGEKEKYKKNKVIQSLDKITKNRQAIMNLMEDLKVEIEERKLVEKNLKAERNLLRTLIDNIPDTIYVFDKECRKIIANKAEVENAGCKSEADLLGKTDLDIYPGETGKRFYSDSMDVIKSEKPKIDKVDQFLRKNGEIRYLNTSQYPLYDTNGLCIGLVGIGHDFTDRKNANDKLVESEERYRLLIENQGEGVGIVNLEENFVFVNPAAEEMFGVEKGGLLNRNLMDFVKPEHKAIIERETKKRTNAEKSSYEIDIIRPNRELRTLIITATPQFTNDGILSGTFGVFRDITERKQMEQKIIESEVYYRTLVDISPDGILITNLEGNVLYGSKKAYEIFGIPPGEDVTGTSIFRWLAPDSQEAIMERVMRIMKGNVAPETREFKLKKFDGSAFWGEISSSPLADKEGNPLSLIIVCRDISDRKKSEYEIIKSKEKAEESDRLKTAFLHNISHEIRTPMNAIIGFSALLSEPDLDEESQKSFIEIIIQSSNHLLTIVSDIIEISNIEAGILKLNIKNTNLNYIFKTLHNQFFPKASEKNNDFKIDTGFKDGEAQVWTDQTKLIQILSILLSNALKFTSGGKITMGYRIKENFIEFFVSDTGIGIPKEHFNKIFERFYQVEHTIARQYEGTGLGLSIAKAYVELLGGEIWLTSEPGSGTTFLFTIPYSSADPTLKEEKKPVVIEAK